MKYDYKSAIQLIRECYARKEDCTYVQIEKALGLNEHIGDKTGAVKGAIFELKKRLELEHGLTINNAAIGKNSGNPVYYYFSISEVKKKVSVSLKKTDGSGTDNAIYQQTDAELVNALSKDNQKLYKELEDAKLEVQTLKEKVEDLHSKYTAMSVKENEYKKIIASLNVLLTLNR